jgi:flagellar protein FlaC
MGKDKKILENDSDEDTASTEEITDDIIEPEKDEENAKESEDTKKNKDDLRRVIKLDSAEKEEEQNKTPEQNEPIDDEVPTTSRESLEQRRAILQSIKDFDFLIKKNQEHITGLNQKFDSVSKDLDDLVSLYEIVSEQMNPFVGLSKVTKKRIDALENFTKEIDNLKERTAELESFAERSGAKLKTVREVGEFDEETQEPQDLGPMNNDILMELSDNDLEIILERALGSLSPENTVDMLIDEFIENLKA